MIIAGIKYEAVETKIDKERIDVICEVWDDFVNMPNMCDPEKSIKAEYLSDPNHPVVRLIIYIYSMKTFLNQAINKASRERNLRKSRSLGPFAAVLGQILETAS